MYHRVFLRRGATAALAMAIAVPLAQPAMAAPSGDSELSDAMNVIRCTVIDGESFCTELGFVQSKPGSAAWRANLAAALATEDSDTGDMGLATLVDELKQLPRAELAERQNGQIESARRAVGRVKLQEYIGTDVAPPPGFFAKYPDLGLAEGSAKAQQLRAAIATPGTSSEPVSGEVAVAASYPTFPSSRYIMSGYATEQERDYWCGPATMQAIDWANDGGKDSQSLWASLMGTTTAGTYIGSMVARINTDTTWGSAAYGGAYTIFPVSPGNTATWFMSLHHTRIGYYGAPVIEHVQLLRAYYGYINYNHGGHYQTGRGYDATTISIIDPYDERDFRTGGAHSAGYHSVSKENLWGATLANPNQNIGW
ncbi:C39 family peptidase [Isoptericola sp. b441]|uniref:C39 family peptidase n=1 Tax=Actinotalea lenta TaxID=3064654 RepID=A0ABT9D5A9_9CELL|nr:C39 family peptidase [Isoptericola sp. b441]MDO8105952.1 C39 family peptidase [Isoptericola sp. b441]